MVIRIYFHYGYCMKKNNMTGNRYKLAHFIVSTMGKSVSAEEYIFYRDENIIRRITYPAAIDMKKRTLIIDINTMHGEDTQYSVEELSTTLTGLPQWKLTKYYQLYDNDKNEKYLCAGNFLLRTRRMISGGGKSLCFIKIK